MYGKPSSVRGNPSTPNRGEDWREKFEDGAGLPAISMERDWEGDRHECALLERSESAGDMDWLLCRLSAGDGGAAEYT